MNTLELLIAARKKIERPECWTKYTQARNDNGRDVLANSPSACKWCGYGAVWSFRMTSEMLAMTALDAACGQNFPDWQDAPERTHDEVLECFSRAIAAEAAKVSGNE